MFLRGEKFPYLLEPHAKPFADEMIQYLGTASKYYARGKGLGIQITEDRPGAAHH